MKPGIRQRLGLGTAIMTAALLTGTVLAGTVQAAPKTSKATVSSTTPVAIPDWGLNGDPDPGNGQSEIRVEGLQGSVTKVVASFHVTHARTSDLDIGVIGPNGSGFAWLFDQDATSGSDLGASCADADRTTFDDAAATAIDAGTTPYAGTFRPVESLGQPLSLFNGIDGNGLWFLDALDFVPGTSGTLECWSLFIETDSGQSARFDSGGTAPIPDATAPQEGPGIGNAPVTMTGLIGGVSSVTVSVWISHPRVADLDVVLVSPTGQEVVLAANVGGTGSNFGTSCSKPTTFDPKSKKSISQGVAPFVGSFRPAGSLETLAGSPANGDWTLRALDEQAGNVGRINCWSLTVQTAADTVPSGVVVTPVMAAQPLRGTTTNVYTTVKNTTSRSMDNVTLTATLPSSFSDIRAALVTFPNCSLAGATYTCTWASIAPGDTGYGGVIAKVNAPKKGRVCLTSSVTATGIGPVDGTQCFDMANYPAGDRGTGYSVGDVAHDLALRDQNGTLVSLSQFAGKYVLLQFTASWCGPSQFEVPQDRDEIAALNAANAMGVEIVYLTVLEQGPDYKVSTQQNASNWVTTFGLTTPVLTTAEDTVQSAAQQHASYNLANGEAEVAFPSSVFIRPSGEIFDIRVGGEESGGTTERFLNDLP